MAAADKKPWRIYHNPRCSKSREALALLEAAGVQPEITEYLKQAPTEQELVTLMAMLEGPPSQLVRTKEPGYLAEPFALDNAGTIARELAKRPELLERPIVVRGKKALIARPPERVRELF